MTLTHAHTPTDDTEFVPPVADFHSPLSRSEVLLIVGGALLLAGWLVAILDFFVPIGARFPWGALAFVGSGLFALLTSGGAGVLAIIALVIRPLRTPHLPHSLGRALVVPLGSALLVVALLSLVGEKVLAIVGLAVN